MAKNIKYLLKDNKCIEYLDFLPITYVLPQDISIFIEEF